jgi:2-polyprenyl-6-methoxyphenol hydroxylase-like FAD-dependent oxidoreductase
MEKNKEIRVLISGASIAGLNTAYWLLMYGFKVTIVERSSHIRAGGQALDVRGPALGVVSRMGILDELKQNSTNLKGMSMVDATTGEETYRSTEHTLTRGKMDSPDIEILRDDLCRLLLESVGNQAEYIFNNSITTLNQDETGVDVTFTNAAPQRFDLVIGADGLRSNVRRLVFGADEKFTRYLGYHVAIFTMPNFLNLDHWEVFFQHENAPIAVCIATDKDSEARTYMGFANETPIQHDYHDIELQKRIVAEHTPNIGKDIPQILKHMQESSNFYFDSINQVLMESWSKGRIVLVGDAGYSPSISLGQGTTVAMVGAYVLAGELATHKHDLQKAFSNYESELREYVDANQNQAFGAMANSENMISENNDVPDFGQSVVPFTLKNYPI